MTPVGCCNNRTTLRTTPPFSMATSGLQRAEQETVAGARELLGGKGILLDHNVGRFVAAAETVWLGWLSRSTKRPVMDWRQ
jgi:hypothetical protein